MKFYRNSVSNAITPLLLLQVGIIVFGSLAIKVTMKIMGYNESSNLNLTWSSNCMFIRNWGFLLLIIPVTFLFFIVRKYNQDQSAFISKKLILICSCVTLGLLYYFWLTYFDANSPYDSSMISNI